MSPASIEFDVPTGITTKQDIPETYTESKTINFRWQQVASRNCESSWMT